MRSILYGFFYLVLAVFSVVRTQAPAGEFVQPLVTGLTPSGLLWSAVATGTAMPIRASGTVLSGAPGAVLYFDTITGQMQFDPRGLDVSSFNVTYMYRPSSENVAFIPPGPSTPGPFRYTTGSNEAAHSPAHGPPRTFPASDGDVGLRPSTAPCVLGLTIGPPLGRFLATEGVKGTIASTNGYWNQPWAFPADLVLSGSLASVNLRYFWKDGPQQPTAHPNSSIIGFGDQQTFRYTVNGVAGTQMGPIIPVTPFLGVIVNVGSGVLTQVQAGYTTLSGSNPVMKTGGGTLVLDQVNTLTGSMGVSDGRLRLAHKAAAESSQLVPLIGGTLTLSGMLKTTVGGLDPNVGGLTDVGNGLITVATGLAATDVLRAINKGRAEGTWFGSSGITSTQVAADNASGFSRAVGWLDAGNGSVTIGYAAPGDTNLDWLVDILDVSAFVTSRKYDTGRPGVWAEGDFNYDGIVDIQDVADFSTAGLYDQGRYNVALGTATVPEPATALIALAGIACGCYSTWRRWSSGGSRFIRNAAVVLVAASGQGVGPTFAEFVTYEMVLVDDAGNAADTTGYGAVSYDYQIGKFEVTIGQYAAFLNAVAKEDPYSLYSTALVSRKALAGIARSGSSGSFTYTVVGPFGTVRIPQATAANRPITFMSWFQAARFANWMSNGQPKGPQGLATTEDGAYALHGAQYDAPAPVVNQLNPNTGTTPLYRIPTEHEWYKAAFYKGRGPNTGYWTYATQSDTIPGNMAGSGSNQANHYNDVYCVTQTSAFSDDQNFLTNVGAFSGSPSAYGTFDQSGNVSEWNDLEGVAGRERGIRGGDFRGLMAKDGRYLEPPDEDSFMGFRLASSFVSPLSLTIEVTAGTQTQSRAGYPTLSGFMPVIKAGVGTLVLDQANTLNSFIAVQGGRLRLAHSTALASSRVVPLSGGTLTLSGTLKTTIGGLDPNAGGLTDVGSGLLTIKAGLSSTDVLRAINNGHSNGSWFGKIGITSTQAAADNASGFFRTVGWLDSANGSVTVGYAAPGDTNLDWLVDILDVSAFVTARKYDTGRPGVWAEGDFNYDGIVDIQDVADFSTAGLYDRGRYNGVPGPVAVPEPTACGVPLACLACAGVSLWRRRQRA